MTSEPESRRITVRLRPDAYDEVMAIMDKAGLTQAQFFPMALIIGARRIEEQMFPEKATDILTPEVIGEITRALIASGQVPEPGRPGPISLLTSAVAGILQNQNKESED